MSEGTARKCARLKDGFAWHEKLLVRIGLAGLVCIAVIGIYPHSLAVAVGYVLFVLVGGLLLIYEALCAYCPYPYEYSDCLFFPPELLTSVVKQRRSGKIHGSRKALLVLTAAGLVLIPQYWLWGSRGLLAGFWILAATIGLAFGLYYCRRCRHGQCALNRAAAAAPKQATDGPA